MTKPNPRGFALGINGERFMRSIGLRSNVFVDVFRCWKRKLFLVAFTQDVRQAEFSQGPKKRMVAATVIDNVGYIYQAFKEALRDEPRIDPDGSLSFLLEHTFKGYANKYLGVKQQKVILIIVLLKVLNLVQT